MHLAKNNPGYDSNTIDGLMHPKITKGLGYNNYDLVVKFKMFSMYLPNECIPYTEDSTVMERVVNENSWPKPIRVYGYDSTWGLAGSFFEAETNCVKERNTGHIATDDPNWSFWSRAKTITTPFTQNPSEKL